MDVAWVTQSQQKFKDSVNIILDLSNFYDFISNRIHTIQQEPQRFSGDYTENVSRGSVTPWSDYSALSINIKSLTIFWYPF